MLIGMRPQGSSPTTFLTIGYRANDTVKFESINAMHQQVHERPENWIHVTNLSMFGGEVGLVAVSIRLWRTPHTRVPTALSSRTSRFFIALNKADLALVCHAGPR
jgi:hypothetical protein